MKNKMDENFDPEIHGIEYNEIAQIRAEADIRDYENARNIMEAQDIFNDLVVLEKNGWSYLIDAMGEKPLQLLDQMMKLFVSIEDYERCAKCKDWKMKLERHNRGVQSLLREIAVVNEKRSKK